MRLGSNLKTFTAIPGSCHCPLAAIEESFHRDSRHQACACELPPSFLQELLLDEHMASRQTGKGIRSTSERSVDLRNMCIFPEQNRLTNLPLLAGSKPIIEPAGWLELAAIAWPHSAGGWSRLRTPPRFPRRSAWTVPAFLRIASTSQVVLGGSFRRANHAAGPSPRRPLRRNRMGSHRSSHRNRR